MLAQYEDTAKRTGARIVHCCGFDSIPSDLGTYFLQKNSKEQFGQYCIRIKMRVKAMHGGLSGGFWAPSSLMGDQLIARLSKYAGLTFTVVS